MTRNCGNCANYRKKTNQFSEECGKCVSATLENGEKTEPSRWRAKPMTNADRIRAMSDEELALFVRAFINSSRCPYDWKGCENCWLKELCNANAYNGELEWLHAPAEGE